MTALGRLPQMQWTANGIPYAVLHRPGSDVTTVSVWILSGSRHETTPGVAHLIEHAVMQAIPPGHRMRVVDEIEACGGDANAVTTRDHVALYARVPTLDAGAALAVLADAATMTSFPDELIAGERRVVQEELRLAGADPTDVVHDVFFETAFGDAAIGRPVGGTLDDVDQLDADDLQAWSDAHIRPEQLAVVVSGGLPADAAAKVLANSSLASLPPSTGLRPADTAPRLRSGRRDLSMVGETAGVVIGGPGFALTDPRLGAADVVIELLAGGNSSVLNEEIRTRRGLSYDVFGGASGYRDTGVWRISISTAPENRDEVVDLSTKLILDVAHQGWSHDDVLVARRRVAGLLRLEAESSLEEALLHGDYAFVGADHDWSLPAHLRRLEALTADDVNACARLMVDQLVLATAGGTNA